jgi:hypothetical protein
MAWDMAQNHHQTSRAIFFLSAGKPGISQVYPFDLFREVVAHAQAGTISAITRVMGGMAIGLCY